MSICPNCSENISYLNTKLDIIATKRVMFNNDHLEFIEEPMDIDSVEVIHFECPICEIDIAYSNNQALNILKGE